MMTWCWSEYFVSDTSEPVSLFGVFVAYNGGLVSFHDLEVALIDYFTGVQIHRVKWFSILELMLLQVEDPTLGKYTEKQTCRVFMCRSIGFNGPEQFRQSCAFKLFLNKCTHKNADASPFPLWIINLLFCNCISMEDIFSLDKEEFDQGILLWLSCMNTWLLHKMEQFIVNALWYWSEWPTCGNSVQFSIHISDSNNWRGATHKRLLSYSSCYIMWTGK